MTSNKTEKRYDKIIAWMRDCERFAERVDADQWATSKRAYCEDEDGKMVSVTLSIPTQYAKDTLTVRAPRRVLTFNRG